MFPHSFKHALNALSGLRTPALRPHQLRQADQTSGSLTVVFAWGLAFSLIHSELSYQNPRGDWSWRDRHMVRVKRRGLNVVLLIYDEKYTCQINQVYVLA